ncbi:TPA: hypothetical protein GDO54_018537 [Pyxicephalus adspersus]|uniref:Uncharacterized protein n=1 Tax=Pyxicephalus adspersus TaxID=30357 RepID=A0AAV2ZDJ7_PYXAD|nr:TPA: hypothetical protein GDO54_018537 [Pyxicephalus adspersus]
MNGGVVFCSSRENSARADNTTQFPDQQVFFCTWNVFEHTNIREMYMYCIVVINFFGPCILYKFLGLLSLFGLL